MRLLDGQSSFLYVSCQLVSLPWLALSECTSCFTMGPQRRLDQPSWLSSLIQQKEDGLRAVDYKGGVFEEVSWTQTSYIQTQMHPYDRFFYDPAADNFTVDRFLDDLKQRYGGLDAFLLWPTYTNIGVDDRNQYDYWRAMPGGLERLAEVVKAVKDRGVRVLMPYNPWDNGTRPEGMSDAEALATLIKQIGADGFNGDTMPFIPEEFWTASQEAGWPLALEPEIAGNITSLNWQTMGWGYWIYPKIPVVDRLKFFSSGKFMTNVCNRWMKRKVNDLQFAYFNGDGYETWENIWGIWNGIVPRDAEAIRRVATIERFFGRRGFLQSPDWVPHTMEVEQDDVFASKWPWANATLWTLVNRGDVTLNGYQLLVPARLGEHFYDCYHGVELSVHDIGVPGVISLAFEMEAEGYGCVLAQHGLADAETEQFLATMQQLTKVPLLELSAEWAYLPQTMVEISPTPAATVAPPGMVLIPRSSSSFRFFTTGVMVEGDDAHGVGFQFPWEDYPHRLHDHSMTVGSFFMDKFPVTVANYSAYLKDTGYRPADTYNWLKNWNGSVPNPPEHLLQLPVTYVGLEEARAYCRWANGGSRLPHSWEWLYAAQGLHGHAYPWGEEGESYDKMPALNHDRHFPGPEPVSKHSPVGDSPFGVADLVGNVWQYTDEFQDAHTRAVMLLGGSNYYPNGSSWYFPQARDLLTHQKYMLFNDRYERAGTVGFRCVKDVADVQLYV
mmetsp:Transcript_50215/g.92764  ORF Transcript_50215/g.92764 Transcript_50215/m.92764 type:complete len:725 (-) Transcript_50215:50-2224(-)